MIFEALLGKDTLWLVFLVSSVLTLFFASKAVKYFTVFSTNSKMNSSALGGILLALITSTPELVTGFVSGATNNSALVYSNITGANSILLVFFAMFSIYFSRNKIGEVKSKNLVAIVSCTSLSILLFAILFFFKESITFTVGDISLSGATIIQLCIYIGFLIYATNAKGGSDEVPTETIIVKMKNNKHILLTFMLFSAFLILSAILLNNAVSRMGDPTSLGGYGLGTTIAGALFLSIVTTLPEIVSMYKLMKVGLFNVAASAGIGSHLFNFTILFISDIVNPNSILDQVYQINYNQQQYIWGIYIISFLVFIHGRYNKYVRNRRELFVFNFFNIPIVFITGWSMYALFG